MIEYFVNPSVHKSIGNGLPANGQFEVVVLGQTLTFKGGPFRYAKEHFAQYGAYRLKMAVEQEGPADHTVALVDFTAPTPKQLLDAAEGAIMYAIDNDVPVYAGCMGGIGRTGTMLAAILKVFFPDDDPVALVRRVYLSHAVETNDQKNVLYDLDVTKLRKKVLRRMFRRRVARFFGR